MNTIFKIISFPVTFIVGFISIIFVLFLNHEEIVKVKNGKLTKAELGKKVSSDLDHFFLYEYWLKTIPVFRMLVALIIYYLIFMPF